MPLYQPVGCGAAVAVGLKKCLFALHHAEDVVGQFAQLHGFSPHAGAELGGEEEGMVCPGVCFSTEVVLFSIASAYAERAWFVP